MALRIEVSSTERGALMVAISGSLDSNTYIELEQKIALLLKEDLAGLIIDLKGLDYISSMGVSAMLKTKRLVSEKKGTFAMINVPASINEVFRIINVLGELPVLETIEEADNYFAQIQRQVKDKNKSDGLA